MPDTTNPFANAFLVRAQVHALAWSTLDALCTPEMRKQLRSLMEDEYHFGDQIDAPCTSLRALNDHVAKGVEDDAARDALLSVIGQAMDAGFTHVWHGA